MTDDFYESWLTLNVSTTANPSNRLPPRANQDRHRLH